MTDDVDSPTRTVELSSSQTPRVSIVVTAWRHAPFLFDCLRSIAENAGDIPYDVTVVCNEPAKDLLAEIERGTEGLRVIRYPVNLGFAAACNRAAAHTWGEHIVLLNDDTEVEPGWLEALVNAADAEPAAGAVGSAMVGAGGEIDEAGAIVWRDGETTAVSSALLQELGFTAARRRVDYCSASSLLVRRSTWDAIGGFDERYYPAYFEDVDLCFRIREYGQEVLCEVSSRVRHHRSTSTTGFYREFIFSRNVKLFVERWAAELEGRDRYRPSDLAAARRLIETAERRRPTSRSAAPTTSSALSAKPVLELSNADELRFLHLSGDNAEEYARELERVRSVREARIEELENELSQLASRVTRLEEEKQTLGSELDATVRERDELFAFSQRSSIRWADKLANLLSRIPGALEAARLGRRLRQRRRR